MAAASIVAAIVVLLLGRAHSIASAHAWCAEHGGWTHLAHGDGAHAGQGSPHSHEHGSTDDLEAGHGPAGDDSEPLDEDESSGDHEHCPWQELCGSEFANVTGRPTLERRLTSPAERFARPAETPRAPPISLVLLAPKQSPPL